MDKIERADVAACTFDGMFRDIFNREERYDLIRVIVEAYNGTDAVPAPDDGSYTGDHRIGART